MQNQRLFCDACEEITPTEVVSGVSRCTVCGASISTRAQSTNQQQQQSATTTNLDNRNEGINIFEAFANGSVVSRGASLKAVERLTRIKPDPRAKTILEPRVRIEVEGIEGDCLGVPASFGPIQDVVHTPLKVCDPIAAHLTKVNCDLSGYVAIVERGGNATFVHKAKVCQEAGAVAMLVIQTFDVWPFTPSDSSNETEQIVGGIRIPVVAINKISGERLVQHLLSTPKDNATIRISMTLCGGEKEEICAICHDNLIEMDDTMGKTTIIQMPCLHYYHEDCLMPWLKSNNTCPTCRFAIESDNPMANEEMRSRLLRNQDTGVILGWFG